MITIKYFGEIAEAINCKEEQIAAKSDNLSELIEELNEKYNLKRFPMIIALNQNRIELNDDITIKNNDELAILPPFAGG
ncbi:MAG: MoaD/ThiS family protein [Flavobacteriaceae bacterium]|nr:MoaD/ThiS family protein [Bacteroidia bacterium]NNL15335.1 MoaD/ThiS family protein [Flavobacteriaceae bacterium]